MVVRPCLAKYNTIMDAKPDAAETGGAPNLWFDIIREARRGRCTLMRVLYIGALFLILLIPYYATSREDPRNVKIFLRGAAPVAIRPLDDSLNFRSRLATNFTVTILVTQWLAALVLMPIYAVSSLHADRRNGSLELLLVTPVNGPQIMNAKLWACWINVSGVLLAGMPLIALVQIFGGVDLLLVAQSVVTVGAAMLGICALSFHIALRSDWPMHAIGRIYAAMAFMHAVFGFFPFIVISCGGSLMPETPAEVLNLVGISGGFYVAGLIFFQMRNGRFLELLRTDMPTFHEPEPLEPIERYERRLPKPEIGDNALVWKEQLGRDAMASLLPALFLAALVFTVTYAFAGYSAVKIGRDPAAQEYYRSGFLMLLVMVIIGLVMAGSYLSFRLAGCIVREREGQTLDALLLLPCSRSEILIAKLQGILIGEWPRMAVVGFAWVLLWFFAPFNLLAALGFVIAVLVQTFFFAAVGFYLSVVCRTSVQAYVTQIVVSLTLLTVPIAIPSIAGIEAGDWLAFHPLTSLFALAECWWSNDVQQMAKTLWPQTIYLLAGVLLTIIGWRRFCSEG